MNWLSVRVPTGTRVGPVAVYNRRDCEVCKRWLGWFEVWVGYAPGDASIALGAHKCGGASYLDEQGEMTGQVSA